MGICPCNRQPSGNKDIVPSSSIHVPIIALKAPSTTVSKTPYTSCDTLPFDCEVAICELAEYCKHYTNLQLDDEEQQKMKSYWDHYLKDHKNDPRRDENECKDETCDYEEATSAKALSQRQIYHTYFYHTSKYVQLKTLRTLHYTSMDNNYKLCASYDTNSSKTGYLRNDLSLQLPAKISKTVSRSVLRLELLLDDAFKVCTTPMMVEPIEDEMMEFEQCASHAHCQQLQKLMLFCRNMEPVHDSDESDDNKHRMKEYFDHCCDSHVYQKYKCMHLNDDADESELCTFCMDLDDTSMKVNLHRHFYHHHIMQKDNEFLEYGVKTMRGQKVIDKFKPTVDALLAHRKDLNTNQVFEFGYEWICKRNNAKFKNPKQELLKNTYAPLTMKQWNQLLKQCRSGQDYAKSKRTKSLKLNLKEVIALKLYTDYDSIQNEYRKCYRVKNEEERLLRQSEFFHWNALLKAAVYKSTDIIINSVFHGLNTNFTLPTFSGTYRGPVSTTTDYDIACGFAGDNGTILELYPSYGKKGLKVSWLSNFPDEQEVLYFGATFDIKNIVTPMADAAINDISGDTLLSLTTVRDMRSNTDFIEQSILKALQTINVHSTILSFNEMDKLKKEKEDNKNDVDSPSTQLSDAVSAAISIKLTALNENSTMRSSLNATDREGNYMSDDEDDKKEDSLFSQLTARSTQRVETFEQLRSKEFVAILHLLYLQYRPTEWEQLVRSKEDVYTQIALAKYRDQFAQLTQNVTTIRMDQASELIKYFFSTYIDIDGNEDVLKSIPSLTDIHMGKKESQTKITHIVSHSGKFENIEYKIRFATIVKLFPKCKVLSIDGDNFDWTLNDFIGFLKGFNLDFSEVQLQDIYILFKPHYLQKDAERIAKKRLNDGRQRLTELEKLGWRFINAAQIHRFGFEPVEEQPFLSLFMNEGRVFHHSYSRRILGGIETSLSISSQASVQVEGDYAIIQTNSKHLFLSKQMLDQCMYKNTLVDWLERRKKHPHTTANKNLSVLKEAVTLTPGTPLTPDMDENGYHKFIAICEKVERLVLYPIHEDTDHIFYETTAGTNRTLLLSTINTMFPNVSDIYLRDTTFNKNVCRNLIQFINENPKHTVKRIFYSVAKQCGTRAVAKLKLRLNECKWDFSVIEQVAFVISSNNI